MKRPLPACLCLLALGAACGGGQPTAPIAAMDHAPAPTNRIDVPPPVRDNLGITFATVERRQVAATRRWPGRFEALPTARSEHRPPVGGRVELAVRALQAVQPGEVLFRLDAPAWRALQQTLGAEHTQLRTLTARQATMGPLLQAHRQHEASLQDAIAVTAARLEQLDQAQRDLGGQAQELSALRVQLAQLRAAAAEAAEQHTETEARQAELDAELAAAGERFRLSLLTATTWTGLTAAALLAPSADGRPHWLDLARLEVRATTAGVVVELPVADGGFVEANGLVATVLDPRQVRLAATVPQDVLPHLRDGAPATAVPPLDCPWPPLTGSLRLGAEGDPRQRTFAVYLEPTPDASWARPGLAASLELTLGAVADFPELAIPSAAVQQDGLQKVFFRRDPQDPDRVIRVEADLGVEDGRWLEVKSGLVDGDQVVVTGAYALMLASSSSLPKGGHFHADGTFHADDHE